MLIFDQLKKNDPYLRLLTVTVLTGLAVLLTGLWWVQVVSANYYRTNLETQSFRSVRVPAVRGKILDRNGVALADNRPHCNVNLYLEELRKFFQKAYSEELTRVRRDLGLQMAAREKQLDRKLTAKERKEFLLSLPQKQAIGRRTRFQVTSNIVAQLGYCVSQPLRLDETNFHRHYDTQLALPMPVLTNLDAVQIARFEEQSIAQAALDLEVQPIRIYPYNTAAAHLLGHVTREKGNDSMEGEEAFFNYRLPDYRGLVGIEAAFDQELRGRAGAKSVLVNNLGYRQTESVWTPVEPGDNVFLTLDLQIQQASERAMQRLGPGGASTRGAVVVMDSNNGDILAMVSSPTMNPNQFIEGMPRAEWEQLKDPKLRPLINRATQGAYAPGSIFKTVIGLAALERGLNPLEIYYVEPDPRRPGRGIIYLGKHSIQDQAPPGEYNFRRALKFSSNAYFITNGLRAGIQNIVKLGQRLHLGERISDLPATRQEVSGVFPTLKRVSSRWFDGNTANVCIGQDPVLVTPLQMAVMTAAFANGGKVLKPRLVDHIEAQDASFYQSAKVFRQGEVRDELGVAPNNLRILREAMLADVEDPDGTGRAAGIPGMRISGKTGTAQVMNERNEVIDRITWFISFAPYEQPRYVVVVMVESGGSGGATCAPIAQEIYLAIQKREQIGHARPEIFAQKN